MTWRTVVMAIVVLAVATAAIRAALVIDKLMGARRERVAQEVEWLK